MNYQAINELIKMVKNEPYFGLEINIDGQSSIQNVRITGLMIMPHKIIEDITELCKRHNLLYFYRVSEENKPEIVIFENEEPF